MSENEERAKLQRHIGALLPGVDPTIGEVVIGAILGNEGESVASIFAALGEAPEEIRAECIAALIEILVCSEKGHLFWLDNKMHSILVGARRMTGRETVHFGGGEWPVSALMMGPPTSIVLRLPGKAGARQVWVATELLDDVYVGASQAEVLGKLLIEQFGGHVVEDRKGGDAFAESAQSIVLSAEARARAAASQKAIECAIAEAEEHGFNRVALAEARPGALKLGDLVHHEDRPDALYLVEARSSDDWVTLRSMKPGPRTVVPAGAWVQMGPGPFGPEGPNEWGFTEAPAGPKKPIEVDDELDDANDIV